MNTTAPAPPAQIPVTCRDCGQTFLTDSLLLGQVEMAHTLNQRCQPCQESHDKELARQAEEDRRSRISTQIESFIPPDLLATDINHPKFEADLWQAVRRWRPDDDSFWLGIIGNAGRCKTRCMALLCKNAMWANVQCVWTTANRLADAVRDDQRYASRHISTLAREHLDECLRAQWLFIDDLGKNEWPKSFEAYFFQLIDHRKNYRKPIIYSSNQHPEAMGLLISDNYREPIVGRLLERTTILTLDS